MANVVVSKQRILYIVELVSVYAQDVSCLNCLVPLDFAGTSSGNLTIFGVEDVYEGGLPLEPQMWALFAALLLGYLVCDACLC